LEEFFIMIRYTKYILAVMLISVLCAGCGSTTGSTSSTKTASSTVAASSSSSAPTTKPVPQKPGSTTITFWYGIGGQNGNYLQTLINKYNQSQSKYYVNGVFQSSYDDTLSKFNTSVGGNSLPNLVQIYDIGTQSMIDSKEIIPAQQMIDRDHLQSLLNDIEPAIRSYYTVNGTLESMPFNSSTAVMYYDKNAFSAAGLNPNQTVWTYDQILSAAKKLTQKDASGKLTRAGVGFYDYSWLLEQELAANGALFSSPNNGRTQRATSYAFNNPAGIKWLEFQKQLIQDGTASYFGTSSDDNASAFIAGKTSITFDSIASLRNITNSIQKNGKKIDVGVAYIPRISGDQQESTIIGGASLWMTKTGTTATQNGAWDFTKFLSQPENQAYWSSNTGYLPIRRSTYNLPDMKATQVKYPQFQVAVNEIRTTTSGYYSAGSATGTMEAARNTLQQAMDGYFNGKISSAQAALNQAAQQATSALSEYNAANS
jgi:sn-glycerol 3-phosphate transport system substrate-binding protein